MYMCINTGRIKTIISVEVRSGDRTHIYISTGSAKWRTKNPNCQPPRCGVQRDNARAYTRQQVFLIPNFSFIDKSHRITKLTRYIIIFV